SVRVLSLPVACDASARFDRTVKPFLTSAEEVSGAPVDVFGMTYALLGARSAGIRANRVTAIVPRRFANWQLEDGHWAVNDARPPMSSSEFTATAPAIRVMSLYMPERLAVERSERVEHTRKSLLEAEPRSTEDRVFRLLGLFWTGAGVEDRRAAASALLGLQQADGGWGQEAGMESDAYATGQSLSALHHSGVLSANADSFRRGIPTRYATGGRIVAGEDASALAATD